MGGGWAAAGGERDDCSRNEPPGETLPPEGMKEKTRSACHELC